MDYGKRTTFEKKYTFYNSLVRMVRITNDKQFVWQKIHQTKVT